ncbi:MAG: YgiT-type zinc finger protein [Gammaproteobacteria bacterium]|nr:YgiT-type zinc finger protein [Gammaproteobacteria bacterium]
MKCTVCGSELRALTTRLPFKIGESRIVILKNLPVLQCENCTQYVLQDDVLDKVDQMLARVDSEAELEVIQYAA